MADADKKVVDDAPFEVPDFDEKDFIRKELISFKQTVVLFVLSIVVAGISYGLWVSGLLPDGTFPIHILLALAIGFGSIPLLLKVVKISTKPWKKKDWLGTMALYGMFWLGFFLLFTNPPIADASPPVIEGGAAPVYQAPGAPVNFGFYLADNVAVDTGANVFCIHGYTGAVPTYESLSDAQRSTCARTFQEFGTSWWNHTESFPAGRYAWYVVAKDANGQQIIKSGWFDVSSPFVGKAALPRGARFEVPDDKLSAQVQPELRNHTRAVQFTLDEGATWHNMRQHPDADKKNIGWWTTDPSFAGWTTGTHNVSLRVQGQFEYLRRAEHVLVGDAVDPTPGYTVTVANDLQGVGTVAEPPFGAKNFQPAGASPAFGLLAVVLAALVAVAYVGRRRDA